MKEDVEHLLRDVREGKKLYECDRCDHRFTEKDNLKFHIAVVHKNKEPYPCEICDKKFLKKKHMKRHIRSVHTEIMDAINEDIEKNKNDKENQQSSLLLNYRTSKYSGLQKYKSAIDVKSTSNENEGIKIMDAMTENIEKLKNNVNKSNLKRHIKLNHEGNEVKCESTMDANQKKLYDKSAIDAKSTSDETEGIKILDNMIKEVEKLENDDKSSAQLYSKKSKYNGLKRHIDYIYEFITITSKDIDQVGKKRKIECPSCLQILNKQTIDKHFVNCGAYQKLIKTERQCSVCEKTFANSFAINQHIGDNHKEAVLQSQKSTVKFTSDELDTMKKDSEQFEKTKIKNN